jgi:hypothetical protein
MSKKRKYEFYGWSLKHINSYVGFILAFASSIHNKQTPAAGHERGDIEIKDYVILLRGEDDRIPPRPDGALNKTDRMKIRHYRGMSEHQDFFFSIFFNSFSRNLKKYDLTRPKVSKYSLTS